MPDREPEYRRRRREEAEENQRYADREWDEATQKAKYKKIVAAIKGIENKLDRAQDEQTPKNKGDRHRHIAEIIALVAAAVVGLLAIGVGNYDASQQRDVMQGQLDEMKNQRLVTIAQTRADLRGGNSAQAVTEGGKIANVGEKIVSFSIIPSWTNVGSTDAIDYRAWFDIKGFDIGPQVPYTLTDKDCPQIATPNPLPEGRVIPRGSELLQLAKFLSLADATAAQGANQSKYVLMWGHAEYRDIYFPETTVHSDDWCVSVVPNDLQRALFSFIILSEKVK